MKFNNEMCEAVDGSPGTCYTASECTTKGGEERGSCASGFGVCCVGKCDYGLCELVTLSNVQCVSAGKYFSGLGWRGVQYAA